MQAWPRPKHTCVEYLSHTHTEEVALVFVRSFQSSFGTFICISSTSCRAKLLHSLAAFIVGSGREEICKCRISVQQKQLAKCQYCTVAHPLLIVPLQPPLSLFPFPSPFPEAFYLSFRMRSSVKQTYNKL